MKLLRKVKRKVERTIARLKSRFDRLGSYTGTPEDPEGSARPEQDADDL